MTEPLDELYFRWLYSQVCSLRMKNPTKTYWMLLKILHTREFVWFVPNDDNRVEDGRDLREEFCELEDLDDIDPEWMLLGCSMLEMLIALARHFAYEAGGSPASRFWQMLSNLKLQNCTDSSGFLHEDVQEILNEVIWRTYDSDGRGGLFPLDHPEKDQREIEIWYQLAAYVLEKV